MERNSEIYKIVRFCDYTSRIVRHLPVHRFAAGALSSVKVNWTKKGSTPLNKNVGNNYKYFNEKTSGLEKSQVDNRANNLMQVSEDIKEPVEKNCDLCLMTKQMK